MSTTDDTPTGNGSTSKPNAGDGNVTQLQAIIDMLAAVGIVLPSGTTDATLPQAIATAAMKQLGVRQGAEATTIGELVDMLNAHGLQLPPDTNKQTLSANLYKAALEHLTAAAKEKAAHVGDVSGRYGQDGMNKSNYGGGGGGPNPLIPGQAMSLEEAALEEDRAVEALSRYTSNC